MPGYTNSAGVRPGRRDRKASAGALADAGYTSLDQLADVDHTGLKRLHGVGPKALRLLEEALTAKRTDTGSYGGRRAVPCLTAGER